MEVAFVDQSSTGEAPAAVAEAVGIRLDVVTLAEAKWGFVLLPRYWVVERSFAWAGRFHRLARDGERLHTTLAGFHFVTFFAGSPRGVAAAVALLKVHNGLLGVFTLTILCSPCYRDSTSDMMQPGAVLQWSPMSRVK